MATVLKEAAIVTAAADEQRPGPLTAESLADRLTPGDPNISPDGMSVAYVVAPFGKKGEKATSAIWVADGSHPPRQVTAGTHEDSAPRWSPDGTRLLFISDRMEKDDDGSRLFILPVAGGEALPLGDLKGSLSGPTWSPDGTAIAVLREDPEPESVKARKKERDDAIVVEEDPRYTRLWVVDLATGKARCLTTADREVRDYCWAPDGALLYTLTTNDIGYDAMIGPSDLWATPANGGLSRHLAKLGTHGSNPIVVQTSEGAKVVLKVEGSREAPSDSVWTVPVEGGEAVNCLPDIEGIVETITALPGRNGQFLARIVERTHGRLFIVDALSGSLTPVSAPIAGGQGSVMEGPTVAANRERLAVIWTDSATPEEVYLGDLNGPARPVTSYGKEFLGRLQPTEHVTWLSDDGVEIEGLLTYPVGYEPGKRYPLVVEIHGGPSWRWEDRAMLNWHDWAQFLASHGYAVLMPNPRGSTGYGHEFQRLLQNDVGGGESRDLVTGALAMVERGIADRERLGIAGWSWGGYLTAWTITQTDIFSAAMMGAGLANIVSDHGQDDIPSANLLYFPGHPYDHMEAYWAASPIRYVANVTTPTLILHGDQDARVHPAQGAEYFRALKVRGVPVRFVRYPREKHGISERAHQIDVMNRLLDWFDRYLKRKPGC